MEFGPEYPKIQTAFKRDERNVIVPGEWTCEEFAYLADKPWRWTEKVDGTNIRLHWAPPSGVTVGGRTDRANVSAKLLANLAPQLNESLWRNIFTGDEDLQSVTVYGEGYGAGIQSGGMYQQEQRLVVFDVRVGQWWLRPDDVEDVATKLGLQVVPVVNPEMPLNVAVDRVHAAARAGRMASNWPEASCEGLVGRPVVDLYNRRGERLTAKVKVKDFTDYERRKKS